MCGESGIPCVVVMFPILHELSDRHPLADVHRQVGDAVRDAGAVFVDLLPLLKGRRAAGLWVHPSDQHPNEIVHRIAGAAVAEALAPLVGR